MSRSKRKTPVIAITAARSDKPFKVAAHRSERRAARIKIATGRVADIPNSKAFGDPWLSPKDGKQMVDPKSKWMRK